jgi:hypothetical protein
MLILKTCAYCIFCEIVCCMLILKTNAYCIFCEIAREQRGEYYHFELCSKLPNFWCYNHLIHIDQWKDGTSID